MYQDIVLDRDIAVKKRRAIAESSEERAESLRFAVVALEEILRYPHGGEVDMLEVRYNIARNMGMKTEPDNDRYPEVDDRLSQAKDEVAEAAVKEQAIASESADMAEHIASGGSDKFLFN